MAGVNLGLDLASQPAYRDLPAVPLPDDVVYRRPHPPRPGLAVSPEATAAFARQAEQDLVHFLQCRERELVPEAKLLLVGPGDSDQSGQYDGLYDVLNDACLHLVAAGRLAREQYEHLAVPVYFRTLEELLAPLEREVSPLRGAGPRRWTSRSPSSPSSVATAM